MANSVKETVRGTFEQYLQSKGLRKTQERFAILDAIYSITGHFTMEQLLESLESSKFRVSRATLYNTMELLVDAHLVVRHKFNNNSQYEKACDTTTHFHRICMACGAVTEVSDDKLREVIENTQSRGFSVVHTSLYIYGVCSKCAAARRRKERRLREQREKRSNNK